MVVGGNAAGWPAAGPGDIEYVDIDSGPESPASPPGSSGAAEAAAAAAAAAARPAVDYSAAAALAGALDRLAAVRARAGAGNIVSRQIRAK